jgi:hypothetical protein
VNLLLDEHERGRRNHSHELWALFMLELWHRRFVDSNSRPEQVQDASETISLMTTPETLKAEARS